MNWLLRLWPRHEHLYSFRYWQHDDAGASRRFHCRCGHSISGDDLFAPDTMMGRYWRENYPQPDTDANARLLKAAQERCPLA